MSREERAAKKAKEAGQMEEGAGVQEQLITPYTVKIPVELHRKIKSEAVLAGVTINERIVEALRAHFNDS